MKFIRSQNILVGVFIAQFASRYFRLPQRRFKNFLPNPFDSKSLANLAFHAGVTKGNYVLRNLSRVNFS